ncbi:MAG: substrate-binding domain-containing protein [Paracoccus sp. (in: a-proteobacteria)]|nr:substrate-binding domain-containing protein [Paracoccus sp. (in: a-proteobacteria)]
MGKPPITLAVAGSLAPALSAFAGAFTAKTGYEVRIHRGPAGLLTRAIRDGLPAEVFVSASPDGPRLLHREGLFGPARPIAQNRMVLAARVNPGGPGDALDLLAAPHLRIGMSTPGADPSGDYAAAFLDRLIATDPGRWCGLRDRCASLYGATLPDGDTPPRSPAMEALCEDRADLLIVYATTAARIAEAVPGTRILPLPPKLAPPTEVCACARCDGSEPAFRFFEELQGPDCAEILHRHGFLVKGRAQLEGRE